MTFTELVRRVAFSLSFALLTLLLAASTSHAVSEPGEPGESDEEAPGASRSLRSRFGFGLEIGYGIGIEARERTIGKDVGDVRFIAINPHLRFLLWEKQAPSRWYHGQLDGLLIATVLAGLEPNGGYSVGAIANLRYSFRPEQRLRPYVDGGIGVGYLAFDLASQSNGFSFYLQGGLGLKWQVRPRYALTASVLWHHISNAQLRFPNNGIDDILFQIGVLSW
jgi:hypothetical protein